MYVNYGIFSCQLCRSTGRFCSLFVGLLLLFLGSPALAQTQPTPSGISPEMAATADTTERSITGPFFVPFNQWTRPAKAAFYSALFPGMGQLYNKKYWKIPIVYAASGVTAFYIFENHKLFREFQKNYAHATDDDPKTINNSGFTNPQTLQRGVLLYRRYRDLSVILFVAAHALNVLDAHVDAHLRDFDVSEDLSFKIKPQLMVGPANHIYPAITLKFNLNP